MELIINLTKEELRNFKLSLKRTYTNYNNNNLSKLADVYRVKKYKDDDEILKNVFNNLTKNAFHKLKNKLKNEVYKSLLILNYGKEDLNIIYNHLLLVKIFLAKSNHQEAYTLLKIAVKKAEEKEAYDILLCVLNELLQLGNDYTKVNVPKILRKKRNCINKLTEINYINDMLSEFIWKLKAISLEQESSSLLKELELIENEIEETESIKNSATLQLQLQIVVRNILLQKSDYAALVNYLKNKIQYFDTNNIFDRKNYIDKEVAKPYKHLIQFNFAVVHFSIKKYKAGHIYMSFLTGIEAEKMKNKEFLITAKVLDILFYYELNDHEFAMYKINHLKNKHRPQLRNTQYIAIRKFINILYKIIKKGGFTKTLKTISTNYINENETSVTNRGINYSIWLKAKLNKEDYYKTLLKNIRSNTPILFIIVLLSYRYIDIIF